MLYIGLAFILFGTLLSLAGFQMVTASFITGVIFVLVGLFRGERG